MYSNATIEKAYNKAVEVWNREVQWLIGSYFDELISDEELNKSKIVKDFIAKQLWDLFNADRLKKHALLSKVMDSEISCVSKPLWVWDMYYWKVKFQESQSTEVVFTGLFSDMMDKVRDFLSAWLKWDFTEDEKQRQYDFDKQIEIATYTISFEIFAWWIFVILDIYEYPWLIPPQFISNNRDEIISLVDEIWVKGEFSEKLLLIKIDDPNEESDDEDMDLV